MVRWCWVNFQCRGVLLILTLVGQGPTVLTVCAGGGCLDIFTPIYHSSFLSSSLWETTRYRLKYCLKVPLSQKQPTNLSRCLFVFPVNLGNLLIPRPRPPPPCCPFLKGFRHSEKQNVNHKSYLPLKLAENLAISSYA